MTNHSDDFALDICMAGLAFAAVTLAVATLAFIILEFRNRW